jgi:hypothetical protein
VVVEVWRCWARHRTLRTDEMGVGTASSFGHGGAGRQTRTSGASGVASSFRRVRMSGAPVITMVVLRLR